ncbi:unnamed protein product [Mesocestoides corti]|uniref:mRNA cap guanine-N(7) methyltransferase n=1 Tax=Mesocestoides corti TaxID=53468 RepID=A0A0R3U571_MESCO|nr:unnamed protein product [Mesocestoides corti]
MGDPIASRCKDVNVLSDCSGSSKQVQGFYDSAAKNPINSSLDQRSRSRIYYLRNLNNWVKSTVIADFLDKLHDKKTGQHIRVLDVCCGKGGDQLKWLKGRVDHVTFVDISSASIDICKQRYTSLVNRNGHGQVFSAEFIVHDCTKTLQLKMKYDLVSCQFALHYGFESIGQARIMLHNVSSALKEGGYFIVTLPNAYEIVSRLSRSKNKRSFGNSIYTITFDEPFEPDQPMPLFGARYHFQLEGVVDCPEYLVYPPLLRAMAEEVGLHCVCGPLPFSTQMRRATRDTPHNVHLLRNMDALETWAERSESPHGNGRDRSRSPLGPRTSFSKPLMASSEAGSYAHVERKYGSLRLPVGTLSNQEWEAFCIYCIFVFRKKDI